MSCKCILYFCIISLGHACLFQHVDLPFHCTLSITLYPLFMHACRIVELFPAVPINPHWGIVSKCLAYSKAACDPFVYSLLRHQYKKTCADITNRLLKRSSLNASGRGHESQGNSIPTVEWQSAGLMGHSPWVGPPGNCQGNMKLIYHRLKKRRTNIGYSCPRLLEFGLTHQKKSRFRQGQILAQEYHCACILSAQNSTSVQWTCSEDNEQRQISHPPGETDVLTQEERMVHGLIIFSSVAFRFDIIRILQYNGLFLHYYSMYSHCL